jgi:hypothetical protein
MKYTPFQTIITLSLFVLLLTRLCAEHLRYISVDSQADFLEEIPCKFVDNSLAASNCLSDQCLRRIFDGLFSEFEVSTLLDVAAKGFSKRENIGGPTILDLNTGFIRDSIGLENLFSASNDIYSFEDFALYGNIIRKLKQAVMDTFGLAQLFFTAPTFITRIDANHSWQPQEIHDEYWHVHSDRNNTPHYYYSGLLYLSTYGKDFSGGE